MDDENIPNPDAEGRIHTSLPLRVKNTRRNHDYRTAGT